MAASDDRINELEQRIADLEAELQSRKRRTFPVGSVLKELVPDEVRTHIRAARRENLHAVRAAVESAIARLDKQGGGDNTSKGSNS